MTMRRFARRVSVVLLIVVSAGALTGCPFNPKPPPRPPKPPSFRPLETPPVRPPETPPLEPRTPASPTQALVDEGQSDNTAKQVICFAADNFYNETTGSLGLPSREEFGTQVVKTLATTPNAAYSYRLKANELYDDLSRGDPVAVAKDLACF